MAKRRRASVREALEAATAGISSPPVRQENNEQRAAVEAAPKTGSTGGDKRTSGKVADEERPPAAGGVHVPAGQAAGAARAKRVKKEGHRKTSTGYLTAGGQEIVRLTLHLTPAQKKKLKIKSLQAGHDNASAYIIEALNL